MKKIYAFIIAITGVVAIVSCTKLNDENFGTIVANQFVPTEKDVAALVGVPYTNWKNLQVGSWNSLWRTNEISADQVVIPARPNGWVDGGIFRRMHEHKWTADEDNCATIWNNAFAGITNCNRLIFQIENSLIPITTNKEQIIAELKVIRASFYYPLCDFFGSVPIITKFDVPTGFLPTQSTRAQVFEFIISELNANIPLLSKSNDATTYGRFNQWAGYALLAKMYLNAGVYTGNPDYANCIKACDKLITSGLYSLEANQANVFATENAGSKEIIFAIPLDKVFNGGWDLHMETLQPQNQATYNFQGSPWGGICAIPQFIDTFDPQDNRLKANWIQGQQLNAAGAILLGSMDKFNGKPLIYINEVPGVDSTQEVHGFRLGKYEIQKGELTGMSNDFPLFRYADVLMMKAESLLRMGDANGAATLVTQVRMRSFSANPLKAAVTGAQLTQQTSYAYGLKNHNKTTRDVVTDISFGRMLDELGWEFAQEGRRRQDLIRFGVFTNKSWLSHVPNGAYRSLLPIPTGALQTNSNLKQNPGY